MCALPCFRGNRHYPSPHSLPSSPSTPSSPSGKRERSLREQKAHGFSPSTLYQRAKKKTANKRKVKHWLHCGGQGKWYLSVCHCCCIFWLSHHALWCLQFIVNNFLLCGTANKSSNWAIGDVINFCFDNGVVSKWTTLSHPLVLLQTKLPCVW